MRRGLGLTAAMVALLATHGAAAAEENDPSFLALSIGIFDVNDDQTSTEGRIEYRFGQKFWIFKPMFGLMVNSDGGLYGYGGINLDIYFGEHLVLMPNFAVGGYRQGDSKNLGSTIEFRSGLELAYRMDDASRIGIAFHHISNASIDDNNPGTEEVVITYSIPIRGLFGR